MEKAYQKDTIYQSKEPNRVEKVETIPEKANTEVERTRGTLTQPTKNWDSKSQPRSQSVASKVVTTPPVQKNKWYCRY